MAIPITSVYLTPTPTSSIAVSINQILSSSPSVANRMVTFLAVPGSDQILYVQSNTGSLVELLGNQLKIILFTTYSWQPQSSVVLWTISTPSEPQTTGSVSIVIGGNTSSMPASANPGMLNTMTSTSVATSSMGMATSGALVPNTNKGSDGISDGAVAGVAIGCLFAGFLIASLIFWFCGGKRKLKRTRDSEASTLGLASQEKGPSTKAVPLENGTHASSPSESGLPQPLEDDAISTEIATISNLIKNHVQSYYHINRVNIVLIDTDDIQALGSDLPVSIGTLGTLIGNPSTRHIALRFCMAWVITSRMQPHKEPLRNFLPPNVVGCYQELLGAETSPTAHSTLIAKWRATTAKLLQSTYLHNPFSATDSRNASIQTAISNLENILLLFTHSRMDSVQLKHNLEEILKRSAQFALTLFSQPSTWEFDWKENGTQSDGLCIFPALVQVTDETGKPVRPPRPFNEAVVRPLDD